MKKFTTALICLTILLNIFSALPGFALTSGDFEYKLVNDTVTIVKYNGGQSSVTVPSAIDGKTVTAIAKDAFKDKESLANISIPDSVISIGENAFEGTAWYNNKPNGLVYIGKVAYKLKNTSLPWNSSLPVLEGTKGIGDAAFINCETLTDIELPDSVENLGKATFYNCKRLNNVIVPDSVTYLDENVFALCSSLTNISLPKGLKSIKDGAFVGCTNLTAVALPSALETIGDSAFSFCINLETVKMSNMADIGRYAFAYNYGLTRFFVPEGVTYIGEKAFANCTSLKNIIISRSVSSFGKDVFTNYPDNFVIIGYGGSQAQQYANSNQIPFILLDNWDEDAAFYTVSAVAGISGGNISINTVTSTDINGYILMYAAYDADNVLTAFKTIKPDVNATKFQTTLTNAKNAKTVKVFLWKDTASIAPLSKCETLDVSE